MELTTKLETAPQTPGGIAAEGTPSVTPAVSETKTETPILAGPALTVTQGAPDAKSVILEAQIESLDRMIESMKETPEEREKRLRDKEQRTEEDLAADREKAEMKKEDDDLQHQIADLQAAAIQA